MPDLLIRRESATSWTLRLVADHESVALGEVHRDGDRYAAVLADGTPVESTETGSPGFDSLRQAAESLVRSYQDRAVAAG